MRLSHNNLLVLRIVQAAFMDHLSTLRKESIVMSRKKGTKTALEAMEAVLEAQKDILILREIAVELFNKVNEILIFRYSRRIWDIMEAVTAHLMKNLSLSLLGLIWPIRKRKFKSSKPKMMDHLLKVKARTVQTKSNTDHLALQPAPLRSLTISARTD